MEPSVSLRSTIRDKGTVPCGLASRCCAPLVGVASHHVLLDFPPR